MAVPADATEVALRALRRRDLSRRELDLKLARAGVPQEERSQTVERLVEAGLVSDRRFAEERARILAIRGSGDAGIRADLRRHGVAREVVDEALEPLTPEAERAAEHFARRGGGERALRYLSGKGFSREALEGLPAPDQLS